MKRFMMLTYGFEQPTPEIMQAWGKWFESIKDKMTDPPGHFSRGVEISHGGKKDLPLAAESITGFVMIEAESLNEATALAAENPFIHSIRVYEIASH